jgi:hypothetical protein
MSLTNRVGLLAGAATLCLTGVAFAESRDANSDALSEIAALKAELAEIKAQQGDNWLTEKRASEIRALVQDVLADADTRASLQASGMTAGWDKGFFLASPDGNFKLKVNGQVQIRYVMNFRDIQGAVQGDRWTHGFENRRTKLAFSGHIVDKTWTYMVNGNFGRGSDSGNSADFNLENAWVQKDFDNGIYVRGGQFKAPFLREELVSSARQLAVERSLVNETYNQDYTQGIEAGFESDIFRAGFMFSDGIGQSSNFWGFEGQNTPWERTTTEWAFTARADFMVAGDWKQFEDFTSWSGESFGLMIGAAASYQRQEFGTASTADVPQALGLTADVSVEFGGANLYGAFIYANPDVGDDANLDQDQFAFVVQGGFMLVPDTFEIFGRYEYGDPDQTGVEDLSLVTVGANWYISKHAAKFTVDMGFSLEDFSNYWAEAGAGWLDGFNEDEYVFRGQFQLLF